VCAEGKSYCGPNNCVDFKTSQSNCGQCKHACFGVCYGGACVDPWEPVSKQDAPAARSGHVAVWTGKVMVVWGGQGSNGNALNTGGIYDPATFTWVATSTAGAPSARYFTTAVWTGSEMIIWGGFDGNNALDDGARFDPMTNSWKQVAAANKPSARYQHTAVYNFAGEMIVSGGREQGGQQLSTAHRYNAMSDNWTTVSSMGLTTSQSPNTSRERHCALWDKKGDRMVVFNGFGDNLTDGSPNNVFFPSGNALAGLFLKGDTWQYLPSFQEPSSRAECTAVYDETNGFFLVFGGVDNNSPYLGSGAGFHPPTSPNGQWFPFTGTSPGSRSNHTAVWLDVPKRMVVFGGRNNSGALDSGGILDPSPLTMTPPQSPKWEKETPRVLSARFEHTAVSTGDKMIVWGGNGPNGRLNDGGIYKP
jgi:hypothetical protein